MNLYFVHDDGRIVTPETGTILEGITRASIIELAGKLGHQVEERKFSIDEWRDGVASGEITEIFACGTAAVVTPVGELKWDGGSAPAPASHRPDHADPAGAGRRAVRPRRGHLRLDAPGPVARLLRPDWVGLDRDPRSGRRVLPRPGSGSASCPAVADRLPRPAADLCAVTCPSTPRGPIALAVRRGARSPPSAALEPRPRRLPARAAARLSRCLPDRSRARCSTPARVGLLPARDRPSS